MADETAAGTPIRRPMEGAERGADATPLTVRGTPPTASAQGSLSDSTNLPKAAKRRKTIASSPAGPLYGVPVTGGKGRWERLTFEDGAPPARWGAASCVLERTGEAAKVVVVGGEGEAGHLGDTWMLDLLTMRWEEGALATGDGGGCAWHTLFVAGTPDAPQLMTFGGERGCRMAPGTGTEEDGQDAPAEVLNDMGAFDFDCTLWYFPPIAHEDDQGVVPARAGHTTTVLSDGRVLVFGGVDRQGAFTNQVFMFHPALLRWESPSRQELRGAPPKARAYHTAVQLGRRLVVFGGTGKATWSMREVYTLDLDAWRWSEHTSSVEGEVPAPRHSHGAVALDDHRILVFGGWDACAEPPCHFGDAAVLDTRTWIWSRVELSGTGPGPVAGHCMQRVAVRRDTSGTEEAAVMVMGGRNARGQVQDGVYLLHVSLSLPGAD